MLVNRNGLCCARARVTPRVSPLCRHAIYFFRLFRGLVCASVSLSAKKTYTHTQKNSTAIAHTRHVSDLNAAQSLTHAHIYTVMIESQPQQQHTAYQTRKNARAAVASTHEPIIQPNWYATLQLVYLDQNTHAQHAQNTTARNRSTGPQKNL